MTKCHLHSSVVLSKLNRHDEALRCLGQVKICCSKNSCFGIYDTIAAGATNLAAEIEPLHPSALTGLMFRFLLLHIA